MGKQGNCLMHLSAIECCHLMADYPPRWHCTDSTALPWLHCTSCSSKPAARCPRNPEPLTFPGCLSQPSLHPEQIWGFTPREGQQGVLQGDNPDFKFFNLHPGQTWGSDTGLGIIYSKHLLAREIHSLWSVIKKKKNRAQFNITSRFILASKI